MSESVLKAGDRAPDFSLIDQDQHTVTLSALKGRRVLLSFHPLAWTPVCEVQMRSLEVKTGAFEGLGVVALGLSIDSAPCKRAWAGHLGIEKTRLLSDAWPHGATATDYGLFLPEKGFSARANVLVDPNGQVEWVKVYDLPQIPDIEEVIRFLG